MTIQIRPLRSYGFTLLEFTLVLIVLGVIAALNVPVMVKSLEAYDGTQASVKTLSQLRYASERLAREIRATDFRAGVYLSNLSTNPAMTALVFTKIDGVSVTISVAGTQVLLDYDSAGITPQVLTDQLRNQPNSLTLTYRDAAGMITNAATDVRYVDIALVLTNPYNGQNYSQQVRIGLRDRS